MADASDGPAPPVKGGKPSPAWSFPAKVAAWVFGLGLLAWPVASLMSIFLTDPPPRKAGEDAARGLIVLLTWAYGPLYAAAFFGYRRLIRWLGPKPVCLLVWLLPALVPAYYIWFSAHY